MLLPVESSPSRIFSRSTVPRVLLLCALGRQAAVNGLSKGTSKRLKSATLRVTTVR